MSDSARTAQGRALETPAHLAFMDLKNDLANASLESDPIVFVEAYQNAMMQDMPFQPDARFAALERLANLATDPTYSSSDVLTAIETAVDAELSYADTISRWTDEVDPKTGQTGRHTHFGRLAAVRDTPNAAQCFDMVTLEYLTVSSRQYQTVLATIVTPLDIVPENLPPEWPCAYTASGR